MRLIARNGLAYHKLGHEPDYITQTMEQVHSTTGEKGFTTNTQITKHQHQRHNTDNNFYALATNGNRQGQIDGEQTLTLSNKSEGTGTSTKDTLLSKPN